MRKDLDGGLVGVVLVQLFSSVRSFRMTLKGYVNMEAQMTYVERVFQYIDLPGEPAASLPSDPTEAWPSAGRIEIENVSLRYRPGLPLVRSSQRRVHCREVHTSRKLGCQAHARRSNKSIKVQPVMHAGFGWGQPIGCAEGAYRDMRAHRLWKIGPFHHATCCYPSRGRAARA